MARELDPELASTAGDWQISVAGRADIPLTAEDLARITQAVRASRTMTRSRKQIAKAKKQLKRLNKQHAELEKLRRGRTGAARKKLSRKLARLRDAKTAVRQRMVGLRHMGQRANEALLHASSGLKSGAGKLVNKALVKATSKALAKVGAMLVPGLNVLSLAMTAWDLYELFRAMAQNDDEEVGAGGGQGDAGDGDVASGDASADAGVEGGADADASDAGEDEAGSVVAGVNEGDAGDLDGGEAEAGDLDGSEGDAAGGETVELHPGAESVLALIEGSAGEPLDDAGREMLNDLVPRDLSDRELDALRERLAARPRGGGDVFATVGAVREEIERIREGEPTSRLVIDGKEYFDTPGGGVEEAKQVPKAGDATGGKRSEEKPAIDDSRLFWPDIGDARQGVRWDAESGRLSIDEKWAAWVKKELRPRSSKGGVGRATSITIASQRDVGAAGQPLIEYTIAIAVEIDVKGHIENHTEQYTLFYDPATGGHSREEAADDLVAAFHSVLDFGADGAWRSMEMGSTAARRSGSVSRGQASSGTPTLWWCASSSPARLRDGGCGPRRLADALTVTAQSKSKSRCRARPRHEDVNERSGNRLPGRCLAQGRSQTRRRGGEVVEAHDPLAIFPSARERVEALPVAGSGRCHAVLNDLRPIAGEIVDAERRAAIEAAAGAVERSDRAQPDEAILAVVLVAVGPPGLEPVAPGIAKVPARSSDRGAPRTPTGPRWAGACRSSRSSARRRLRSRDPSVVARCPAGQRRFHRVR